MNSLIWFLLIVASLALVESRGGSKPGADACRSTQEMKVCRDYCNRDRDCTEKVNRDCAGMCAKSCSLVNVKPQCNAASILFLVKKRKEVGSLIISNKRDPAQAATGEPKTAKPAEAAPKKSKKKKADGLAGVLAMIAPPAE
ncbi:hypothetical protein HDE_09409 [Halotydeus destructor]|nr:hypothetical protein HDE_09409 [Halotydeus destructor]